MFDWILSAIYKAVGKAADSFAQTLIGDTDGDGVLALKLSSLVASFPGFATLYEILQGFAIGLTIILAAYSMIKFFVGSTQDQRDTPIATLIRSAIAGCAIYFGNYAVDLAVQAANAPYTAIWHANIENAGAETISISDVAGALAVGDAGILLSLIFLLLICWNLVKLFLEMFERLFMVGVLAYTSPLVYATIASSATSQVFRKWANMLVSQLVLMSLTAWSLKLILASMANVATIPGFLFVLAACRIAQRMDTYLQQLGLNSVTTGAGLVGELAAAGYIASRALRGKGGHGEGRSSAPLGANLNNGIGPNPKSSYFGGVLGGAVSAVRKGSYVRRNGGTMQETVRAAGKGFVKGMSPFQRFKENAAERTQAVEAMREAAAVGAATAGSGGSYAKRGVVEEKPGSRRVNVPIDGDNRETPPDVAHALEKDFVDKARAAGMRPDEFANDGLALNGAGGFEESEAYTIGDMAPGRKTALDDAAKSAGLYVTEGGESSSSFIAGPARSRQEFLASQKVEQFARDRDLSEKEDAPKYSPYTVFCNTAANMNPAESVETLFAEGTDGGIGRLDGNASQSAKTVENEVVNDLAHAGFDDAFARHGIKTDDVQYSKFTKDITDDMGSVISFTGKDANGTQTDYMIADQAAAVSRVEFSRASTSDYRGLGSSKRNGTEYGSINVGGKNYAVLRKVKTGGSSSGKPDDYVPPAKPKKQS